VHRPVRRVWVVQGPSSVPPSYVFISAHGGPFSNENESPWIVSAEKQPNLPLFGPDPSTWTVVKRLKLVEFSMPEDPQIAGLLQDFDGYLRNERVQQTLQPTALVHELYARLPGQDQSVHLRGSHVRPPAAVVRTR
jgi:hypothetical protein